MNSTDTEWTKGHQENTEPDFYGKWIDRNIEQPQSDLEVIACCDDDVKACIYRDESLGDWFELPNGRIFEATHWMPMPEAFLAL